MMYVQKPVIVKAFQWQPGMVVEDKCIFLDSDGFPHVRTSKGFEQLDKNLLELV